jgi:hypothetical protein
LIIVNHNIKRTREWEREEKEREGVQVEKREGWRGDGARQGLGWKRKRGGVAIEHTTLMMSAPQSITYLVS